MKTQEQIYWQEHRKIADANELFMDFVKDGMTREELQKCIDRRPEVWSRYNGWLDKLPTEQK